MPGYVFIIVWPCLLYTSESVLVDEKVIEGIESLIPLAPLHNKAHVQGCLLYTSGRSALDGIFPDSAVANDGDRPAVLIHDG